MRFAFRVLALCSVFYLPQSGAVNIAEDGIGEVAIAPYYSVRNNWWTLIQVTNTQDVSTAVSIRLREALNGREVRSLVVALSPFDVWTGVVRLNPAGIPVLRSTDQFTFGPNVKRTCTLPQTTDGTGQTVELPLTTAAYDDTDSALLPDLGLNSAGDAVEDISGALLSIPRNDDGGPQDIDRTQEGWIEFISMGYAYVDPVGQTTDTTGRILVGNAIEQGDCDLVATAFSEEVHSYSSGGTDFEIPRILETARQFGEPINSLRVNVRMLNVTAGKETDIPTTHWANFYNPGAQLLSAEDLRLIEADLTGGSIVADANTGVLTDIGSLQLVDLIRARTGTPLDAALDGLESALQAFAPLDPATLPCNRGTEACGSDRDRYVFPEDNATCTITRDAQRSKNYFDWQPDGGARPDGLLRALALSLDNGSPAQVSNLTQAIISQSTPDAHSCRNLVTVATGARALEPSLNDAYPAIARFFHDGENQALQLIPLNSNPDGYNLPEDKRGIDALSLTIMRRTALNEWAAQAGLVGSDWIVTMPTKPFYTDRAGDAALGLLEYGGEHNAVSPRSSAPILTAPFGTDLLSPTARPESILRETLRAYALENPVSSAPTIEAAAGLPEDAPYPPFREAFGQTTAGDRSSAQACNDVALAALNRAGEQVDNDGTATDASTLLEVLPSVLGDLVALNEPATNLGAQLCYGSNVMYFSQTPILGSEPTRAINANSVLANLEPTAGWAKMELDLYGRVDQINVGSTATVAPVDLAPIATAGEYPEDGASMGFIVAGPTPNTFSAAYVRGLPVLGFGIKERFYGDATANYVSTSTHSYIRGFTETFEGSPDQVTFP